MSCEHEVRFTIKPTDDACRFHFDVRAYKDRIVAPDEYSGVTEVTPTDETQILPTKDKLVRDDITVLPAPTEYLSTDHNGTFTPSSGKVGFSAVTVDVNPDLRPLSVSENGTYEPDGFDGFSQVSVDVPQRFTLQTIADRSALKNLGEITISVSQVTQNTFNGWTFETIHLPDTIRINNYYPFDGTGIKYIDIPNVENLGNTFYGLRNFLGTYGDGDGIVKLKNVTRLDGSTFYACASIHTVYFYKKATMINPTTFRAAGVRDIYVPWSEGEVAGAPWEANNATIHYDTVYDEDGNVVSST